MLARCELHPISVKLLRQGHPWVTLDAYSRRFPQKEKFVQGTDVSRRACGILLNDPQHKHIRGRLWSRNPVWQEDFFLNELEQRLTSAKEKRLAYASLVSRENKYWCFGEADDLAGLFLLQLKDQLVVQLYTSWWLQFKAPLQNLLLKIFPEFSLDRLWLQLRSDEKNQRPPTLWNGEERQLIYPLQENGMQLLARLGVAYDYGLYTDMAGIRQVLLEEFRPNLKVLNLYSYTGAFSVLALIRGASQVVSVDLSAKYLEWLEENLTQNRFTGQHTSLKSSAEEALKKLLKDGQQFDLIISDPPSSSSDGQKRTSALKSYETQWQDLQALLAPRGKLLSFLNTHTVSMPKFEASLKAIPGNVLKIQKKLFLQQDCPTLKGFPEGNYLKGILWQ